MKMRIKFPVEAIDFIENLYGFESIARYQMCGDYSPCEWGRIRDGDNIIYFDYIPAEKKPTKKQFVNVKIEIETPSDWSIQGEAK